MCSQQVRPLVSAETCGAGGVGSCAEGCRKPHWHYENVNLRIACWGPFLLCVRYGDRCDVGVFGFSRKSTLLVTVDWRGAAPGQVLGSRGRSGVSFTNEPQFLAVENSIARIAL